MTPPPTMDLIERLKADAITLATPGYSLHSAAETMAEAADSVLALMGEVERLRGALLWIAGFAAVRSEDGRRTFVRVQREAIACIAKRAGDALSASPMREAACGESVAGSEAQRSTGNTLDPPTLTPGEQS